MKSTKLALAILVLTPALAVAEKVPTDAASCFDMSGEILVSANDVPDEIAAKVEQLAKDLEADCDAGKFDAAAAKADELKALIGSK
jgi:hypothetical protein